MKLSRALLDEGKPWVETESEAREWHAPPQNEDEDWKYIAYFGDLRLTAKAVQPSKRKVDRDLLSKSIPRISKKDLPSYRAEVGTPTQGVEDWLREKWKEHDKAEKCSPATGKENYQIGAHCVWSPGVLSHKPKTLRPPNTMYSICAPEDINPLRVPVLAKIVGKDFYFREQYWWTRNIPSAGLGSIHEVKNLKRVATLIQQKKATLCPAPIRTHESAVICHPSGAGDYGLSYACLRTTALPEDDSPRFKVSSVASKEAVKLADYFEQPRDLPYDIETEQPAIKYVLPSATKSLGSLRAQLKQNPRTKAWTLRRRWSENGKRQGVELYLGRVMSEPRERKDGKTVKKGEYIDKPSLEQLIKNCWEQASLATDQGAWLQWFCTAQALRMTGATGTDYGTEDTSKDDALQQQPRSLDTEYVSQRDLLYGEEGVVYEVVKRGSQASPTAVDDSLDDERVKFELKLPLLVRKEEEKPKRKPEQTPVVVEAEEEKKPKPRYAFRPAYGPRFVTKKLENAKVYCVECLKPRPVNRFHQQTEWMKLRCGHERFLCLKCGSECLCKRASRVVDSAKQ